MAKLSPAERAMLILQYRTLGEVQGDTKAYEDVITILDRGYESEYENNIYGLDEPFSLEDAEYVRDVLWLYYLMKLTKNRAAVDDPGGDRDPSGRLRLENMKPKFEGFDGNRQPRHLGYAQFLIKTGQFVEHNHYLNSHGSERDYASMISLWKTWGKPSTLNDQQVDDLLAV